ncbi:MAG: hypothetical protein MUE51_03755 [Thermoleophilia bacterium]|jgi:hypothetical protein|nr:hypothetical protein [Thermoleophilia bacterium]
MTPLSALSCLWDDPDRCPQVRRDGVTGLRYCRLCGAEEEPPAGAEASAAPVAEEAEPQQ